MTGWSVVVARTAERDLTEAVLYIKDRLGNQAAALRLLDEFESIVADIANNPEARPLVRNARIARLGYRWARRMFSFDRLFAVAINFVYSVSNIA